MGPPGACRGWVGADGATCLHTESCLHIESAAPPDSRRRGLLIEAESELDYAHGALTTQLVSSLQDVVESQALLPPLLAMYTVKL